VKPLRGRIMVGVMFRASPYGATEPGWPAVPSKPQAAVQQWVPGLKIGVLVFQERGLFNYRSFAACCVSVSVPVGLGTGLLGVRLLSRVHMAVSRP
jgi:hypothetical protein